MQTIAQLSLKLIANGKSERCYQKQICEEFKPQTWGSDFSINQLVENTLNKEMNRIKQIDIQLYDLM